MGRQEGSSLRRICLAGYFGFGNLGDELMLRAEVELLREMGFAGELFALYGPKGDPPPGVGRVDRWSLAEVVRVLGGSDLLILGGGSIFQDATSLRSPLYYAALVFLARAMGVRVWAFGHGVGPLRRPLSRWVSLKALGSCDLVTLRDERSLSWLSERGLPGGRLKLGADPAFSLTPRMSPSRGGPWLLLNLRPTSSSLPRLALKEGMALAEGLGLEVKGVALSEEDEALMSEFGLEAVLVGSLEEAARLFEGASLALGMRYHFLVLSAMAGVPFVGVPYDPKVVSLCGAFGMPLLGEGGIPRGDSARDALRERSLELGELVRRSFRDGVGLLGGL